MLLRLYLEKEMSKIGLALLYMNEAGIYGGQNKIGVHVYHVGIAIYT